FPVPLLRVHFIRGEDGWEIRSLGAISTDAIPEAHWETVLGLAREYFSRPTSVPERRTPPRYSLAILRDPDSDRPPSNEKAIERFAEAAERLQFSVELIDKDDYGRVAEFDALFLRS